MGFRLSAVPAAPAATEATGYGQSLPDANTTNFIRFRRWGATGPGQWFVKSGVEGNYWWTQQQ